MPYELRALLETMSIILPYLYEQEKSLVVKYTHHNHTPLMDKIFKILINSIPIIIMVGLIPFIVNDYILSFVYLIVIAVALFVKKEKYDITALSAGLVIMLISEYFFISTGVETFNRASLFGVMPIWLPLLWAYGFVAIKRTLGVLNA